MVSGTTSQPSRRRRRESSRSLILGLRLRLRLRWGSGSGFRVRVRVRLRVRVIVTGNYFCVTGHYFCFVTGNYFCFVTSNYFCFVTKSKQTLDMLHLDKLVRAPFFQNTTLVRKRLLAQDKRKDKTRQPQEKTESQRQDKTRQDTGMWYNTMFWIWSSYYTIIILLLITCNYY